MFCADEGPGRGLITRWVPLASAGQGVRSRAPPSFLNGHVLVILVTCRPRWTVHIQLRLGQLLLPLVSPGSLACAHSGPFSALGWAGRAKRG